MSYSNYIKAVNLLPKCDMYFSTGGKALSTIEKAEEVLEINFSRQIREYLAMFGYASFFGSEIYGIIIDTFDDFTISAGSMVQSTLMDRKEYNLPKEWIMIYF